MKNNTNPLKLIIMRNIFKSLLVMSCITLLLYSCENEIESELQSFTKELDLSPKTRALETDSLELGNVEPSKMTNESKALKDRMDELKKMKPRATSSNYDQYLSTNMWAIRELPFTLKKDKGYLSSNGRGQNIRYYNPPRRFNPGVNEKFYIKVPPSITGIPYLIYSDQSGTPLAVGHYTNNPNQKILLVMNDNSTEGAMASWDIISATNNPGKFVIQNELYIGQGSSGSWWDIFNYVIEIQGDNIGFNKYSQRAEQEFVITPDASFTLKNLEFINPYSATVTQRDNIAIQQATTNSSSQSRRENLEFERIVEENSYFEEEKGISFRVPTSNLKFARPTVTLGEIDIVPNSQIPTDTKYEPGVRKVFQKTLKIVKSVLVKPRTKLTMTYYYKVYDVSIDYVATIEYEDRIAKLPGRWSGRIYVDEIFEPDFEEINLDTQRSVKGKVNIRNTNQSSLITF